MGTRTVRTVTTTERRAGALAYGAGRHGRSSVNVAP